MSNTGAYGEKKLLSQKVADQITELIRTKPYAPGEQIPNELELSNELGAARSTIREAIKLLTSRNILYIRRGVGTFVSEKPGLVENPWGLDFLLDDIEIARQLIELRIIIEPDLARLAAERATDEEILAIRESCRKTEDKIFSGQPHDEEDMQFHLAIAQAAHNIPAIAILRQVYAQSIPMQTSLSKNSLLKETIETHGNVTDSIAGSDPDAAFEYMKKHLEYNRDYIDQLTETARE